MKKLVMAGMVGMIMMMGSVVFGGAEDDGITVLPEKAISLNQKIIVTLTAPKDATFVKGSWTGPGRQHGVLVEGVNTILAKVYSQDLKDYKFVVTWKRDGESPWPAHREATLYKHPIAFFYAKIIKKVEGINIWEWKVRGNASPKGANVLGVVVFKGTPFKKSQKIKNNIYNFIITNKVRIAGVPISLVAGTRIDGVLLRTTGKIDINEKSKPFWMR